MLGKVKQWLGIEGVKLELIIPDEYPRGATLIKGTIRLQSMQPQTVTRIKVVLIERYTRGKGAEKRIDEYELGAYVSDQLVEVPANESVEIPFPCLFGCIYLRWTNSKLKMWFSKGLPLLPKNSDPSVPYFDWKPKQKSAVWHFIPSTKKRSNSNSH